MDLNQISNLIKNKRKEKGLTQEELAQKIHVTEKAISRWETGRGTPDISLLVPLSEVLEVSVSEILKGKEDKKEDRNILEIVEYIDNAKKKKNKYVIPIATALYGILLLLYLWYLKNDYNPDKAVHISYLGELIINLFFMSSIFIINRYISNFYYDTISDRERMNKISYIMIFIIYMIMIFNMTIYSRSMIKYSYNLIPFKTIIGYWSQPNSYDLIINILGNIIIVMPIQFLLIRIFSLQSIKNCLVIDIIIMLLIETIQLISCTGVFDIDDMILYLIGMTTMYFIVTGKHKILNRYKTIILSSIISLVITFVFFEALSWYKLGDIPTPIVLLRLIAFFVITEIILYSIYNIIIQRRKR